MLLAFSGYWSEMLLNISSVQDRFPPPHHPELSILVRRIKTCSIYLKRVGILKGRAIG